MNLEKFNAYFNSVHEEMVVLTEYWSTINSHSYHIEGIDQQAEALIESFSPLADSVEKITLDPIETFDLQGNLKLYHFGPLLSFKKKGTSSKKVLLVGHMDTVYPKAINFPTFREGNQLHGPGVADMKGGLVVCLYALKALQQLTDYSIDFELLITPDEEIGSQASTPHLKKAAKGKSAGLIFEPALPGGSIVSSRPASYNLKILVQGKAAHIGRHPEMGASATFALSSLINQLSFLHDIPSKKLVNVGMIQGGTAGNTIPEQAACTLNIRTPDQVSLDNYLEILTILKEETEAQHKVKIKIHFDAQRGPKIVDKGTQKLMDQLQKTGELLKSPIKFKSTGGVSDGNLLSSFGLPVIDTLGPVGHNLHSTEEFLEIDSLKNRGLLTACLLNSCGFTNKSANITN